jgi:hypothetical protein
MKSVLRALSKPFWLFGLAVGSSVSLLVTIFVTVWEWIENPGGIFRDEMGTHWQFVYDTAISWLLPTFLYVAIASSIIHLLFSGTKTFWRARSKTNGNDGV